MSLVDGIQFYRLISAPRLPREGTSEAVDPVPAHLFAALTAAHAELTNDSTGPISRAAVAVAWDRPPGQRGVRILVGGRPWFPPAGHAAQPATGIVPVLYPPGSTAHPVETADLARDWEQLPAWVRCTGQPDPLWTPDTARQSDRLGRGGFDDYVTHLPDAFAWLVIAEPLSTDAVDRELLDLETRLPRLRQRENSEPDRIALLRAEGRYRELARAHASGLWNVHILVGGPTPTAARRAAALLCSASDLDDLPYILAPGRRILPLAEVWDAKADDDRGTPLSPFAATAEFLAAVARPPRRELPGIRLAEPAEFDVTPEHDGDIHLGAVLDSADQPVGDFAVTRDTLNRHTFVAGATGSGKSQTVRHLLEQLNHASTPWLVIEPAKAEYARMAGRIGSDNLILLHPGDPDAVPYGLNPLQPESGFPLQTHIDLVRALFLAAFEPAEPFPQVLSQALDRCYRDLGWDPTISASRLPDITPRYPRLGDLHRTALAVVEGIGYGKEIADNVRGFVDVRIRSLQLGTPGRFFDGRYPLDIADLLRRNVILEIEDIGTDTDKAFLIGAVLIRIVEHLRIHHTHVTTPAESGLRHVTVVEEAHRLLKRAEPGTTTAHAVELFTALLAEIRAYGEGIVIAEQIPDKIVPDVLKNTALKIVHRLPAAEDRDAVGATMNLDDAQSRHVVSLPPGWAAVFADGMDRPLRITVPYGETREANPTHPSATPQIALSDRARETLLTARDLAKAEQLADDPRLMLWIELLIAAHLVNRPAPRPVRDWLDSLNTGQPQPILDHAIDHRIQLAIDSRYAGLAAYYQPESLADHITDAARRTLDGVSLPCDGNDVRWQAGPYRWADVFTALNDPTVTRFQPHPDTALWARRGLKLTGGNLREQLRELNAHPDSWRPDHTAITGTDTPSVYDQAVAALSPSSDPTQRLIEAAQFLGLTTTWPVPAFTPPTSAEGPHDGH